MTYNLCNIPKETKFSLLLNREDILGASCRSQEGNFAAESASIGAMRWRWRWRRRCLRHRRRRHPREEEEAGYRTPDEDLMSDDSEGEGKDASSAPAWLERVAGRRRPVKV